MSIIDPAVESMVLTHGQRYSPSTNEFGLSLYEALEPIFDGSPLFVSDSYQVLEWLTSIGCFAISYDHLSMLDKRDLAAIAIMPTSADQLPSYDTWHTYFTDSRVLILPFVSFDPSLATVQYSLGTLTSESIPAAVAKNQQVMGMLSELGEVLPISGPGCDLICKLEQDVTILRPKVEVEIEPGEWESIGAYFEVGMVPTPEDFKTGIRPGYVVDGELEIPGVAVAHHRHVQEQVRAQAREAWQTLARVRESGGFPIRMTIENSIVRQIRSSVGDLLPELTTLTNPQLGGVLTEMSFSTNVALSADRIDWRHNSQLNEGAEGIHVALGDGVTGAHIDFIAPGVTW